MSHDFWDYTYKQWDRNDDMRRVERYIAIDGLRREADRLANQIDIAKSQSRGRGRWKQLMNEWAEHKTATLEIISEYNISGLRDAWYEQLDKIDWNFSSAERELKSLLGKVESFLSPFFSEEVLSRLVSKGDADKEMQERRDLSIRKEIASRLKDLISTQEKIDEV